MNDLDFPDEPDYVPMVDLHLGVPVVKPFIKQNPIKKQKDLVAFSLDATVILLFIANVWLFISVWRWII